MTPIETERHLELRTHADDVTSVGDETLGI